MSIDPSALRLYLVADPEHCSLPLRDAVRQALQCGVTAVQLRAKHLSDREHLALAKDIRMVCRAHHALFLVNDRVDIAMLAHADGVHVGISDLSPTEIRLHLPGDLVIGYSPGSTDDIRGAQADYAGIGPVFGTSSKSDAGEALGLDLFSQQAGSLNVPVVGIGGITPDNARSVIDAGACGVAVISSILHAPDVSAATRRFMQVLDPVIP